MNILTSVSLAIWDIPIVWHWTCYILSGCSGGLSGLIMAWAHEICTDDNEERALVIATMNEIAYLFQAWLPLVIWQQVEAPEYHKGFVSVSFISGLMIVLALVVKVMWKRELEKKSFKEELRDISGESERLVERISLDSDGMKT